MVKSLCDQGQLQVISNMVNSGAVDERGNDLDSAAVLKGRRIEREWSRTKFFLLLILRAGQSKINLLVHQAILVFGEI